ncbi:formyl transferase [Podospora fimiseda]|uniref:methionyl-tRNA formyltransferase n=1 Tax=Podospora fimiseda TaxID=252190 RepID=A0AAN7BU39_9PEZI|nr:formyl transferase [Podospora fimiseda]
MLLLRSRPFLRATTQPSLSWPFSSYSPRLSSTPPLSSTLPRTTRPRSDPLRILFCGTDIFATHSLTALHDKMISDQNLPPEDRLIESIEVMVRPPKPTGRGNKQLFKSPVHVEAEHLRLPIHVRDTFTGWTPPSDINLLIAVSFGLWVPKRILDQIKYGGLNVHPSLLPSLRGPAPIHQAILYNYIFTGVSVQTLSTEAFDHGIVLKRSAPKEFPINPDDTFVSLRDRLAPKGAQLLLRTLRTNRHVPPVFAALEFRLRSEFEHAPKLTKADEQVDWLVARPPITKLTGQSPARRIYNQFRALGPLWTHIRPHNPSLLPNSDSTSLNQVYRRLQLMSISLPEYPSITFERAAGMESKIDTTGTNEDKEHPLQDEAVKKHQEETPWNIIDWAQEDHGQFRFIPTRWAPVQTADKRNTGRIVVEIPPHHRNLNGYADYSLIYIDGIKEFGERTKDANDVLLKNGGRRLMNLTELRKHQAVLLGMRKIWATRQEIPLTWPQRTGL